MPDPTPDRPLPTAQAALVYFGLARLPGQPPLDAAIYTRRRAAAIAVLVVALLLLITEFI